MSKELLASGCVAWRRGADGPEIAVVHRPRYDDWSLPKGKLERGETLLACAARETVEETGLAVRLGARLGEVHYDTARGPKTVHYWAGEIRSGAFEPNDEVDELRFLDPQKAARLLTYPHDAAVVNRFVEIGVPTSTILLVRHAEAGNRAKWDGDDDLRPLSATGREQVEQLDELLPLFGPDRVVSAPPLRCRDTVAPVAAAAGLQIGIEPALGERGYQTDPGAGLARFRELAAQPGVTIVCSQGGVIPDLVAALVGEADLGVDPGTVAARKGSTWVLTFVDGALRAADYYPTPTG
ncbi:8-oxo-dGTP diphosphatase [Pseudonocardia thermophila]|jgi:Fructose-2,6-bisphosphatase|uniref:8-oxo-dGTP diphosphatase n=1 Tax=Pseudonocardia thermophila TaxID=1848 RepID=A0A1M6QKE2_PSETH|nr:NUDIX hydrolase [Pseudonocardia thermophila]SHK20580.1 8-oxo-dGTP diphosphatase [Pseudonocardia thermophila]